MSIDSLLESLESKNEEICQFLKRRLNTSYSEIDETIFNLLSKKLYNHDKLLVDALLEMNTKFEKLTMLLIKHSK